jgi:hypothetical protein
VPTILSLSKSPVPPYLDGIDLAQIVVRSKKIPRVLFTDTWRFAPTGQIELDQVAAYNDTSKAIFDNLTGNIYCYDDKSQPLLSFRLIGRFGNRHADVLANAVSGYIEETGGTLDLSD